MKKKERKHENNERWLLTYSDLITLLMIFFVIMYASSNVDKQKYKKLEDSFNSAFGGSQNVIGEGGTVSNSDDINVMPELAEPSSGNDSQTSSVTSIDELKEDVDTIINSNNLSGEISTKIEERGLVVSLVNNVFFDSAKATIRDDMREELIEVTKVLKGIDNYIRVEGHTDSLPIHNEEFNSNWELSSVRASNVVEFLVGNGVNPEKLSAVGYGEYRPVADNSTDEGRGKNRRIDIVILDSTLNKDEAE